MLYIIVIVIVTVMIVMCNVILFSLIKSEIKIKEYEKE